MADGRLFLACDRCGEQLLIFKDYLNPGSGYVPARALEGEATLAKFIDAHATGWDCLGSDGQYHHEPAFSVVAETDDHWAGRIRYFGNREPWRKQEDR